MNVTEVGIHELTNTEYHAQLDWLSSTGARKLLPPSCPALFRWEQDNPRESTRAFDIGHAAHDMVLGGGPEIVRVEADSWRTTKAKDAAEEARGRGAVPILAADHDQVKAMADSIRSHPFAGRLFEPGSGVPEASLFWMDDETSIGRRARLDWLPHSGGRRLVVPDLKTCKSAQRDEFAKSAANFGYPMQAAYYVDAVKALGLADDAVFVFVAVEKTPPYLVNVIQLDVTAMRIGAAMNRQAIRTYARCLADDKWPSYSDDVELASLPVWFERLHEDALVA